jgi:triacylglycerol lipase
MKKIIIAALAFLIAIPVFAGGSDPKCNTKYPVVLAHGMGASATIGLFGIQLIDYWGRIPDALQDENANVYITSVNGMDSTVNKAKSFKTQVLQILAITGASKVNIIGHSHGTIYSRYMISNLGMDSKVASYTSLAGPHRGSDLADALMYGLPDSIVTLVAGSMDVLYAFVFGDTNPQSIENGYDVTTTHMINNFNPNTPDKAGIYYQSYGAKVKTLAQSGLMEVSWLAILALGAGANDGLVPESSAKWTNYKGTISGAWWCTGIDHLNMVDMVFGLYVGWDAPDFYVGVVEDLKNRGF